MSMTTANKYKLHAKYVTFIAAGSIAYDATAKNGSAHVGKCVMMTAEDTVGLVTAGLEIIGVLIKVEPDGFCTVQDEGYADVPTTGTVTYTNANNGAVGGATAGYAAVAAAVPAAAAVRTARFIKGDGANKAIIKL